MKITLTTLAVLTALLMIPYAAATPGPFEGSLASAEVQARQRYFNPVAYHEQNTAFPQTQYFDPVAYHAQNTAFPGPRYFDPVAYHVQNTAFPETRYFDPRGYHARFTAFPESDQSPGYVNHSTTGIRMAQEQATFTYDNLRWAELSSEYQQQLTQLQQTRQELNLLMDSHLSNDGDQPGIPQGDRMSV